MAADDLSSSIYLGFSTTNIWLSRLIRAATGSKYSHCWVRHGSAVWGGTWVTHADWPVVRQWPWRSASAKWTVQQLYAPRFDIRPALAAVRKDFEARYDIPGLFGMVFVELGLKWFKRRLKNPLASPTAVFCSEFIAEILIAARLPGTEGWDARSMAPEDVADYVAAHPEAFTPVAHAPAIDLDGPSLVAG
jgi:hypothetical protein